MTLTPLEISLLGILGSVLVASLVRVLSASKYVTVAQLEEYKRQNVQQCADQRKQKCSSAIANEKTAELIFRMLRAIILQLPISEAEKIKILNDSRD